MPYKRGDIVLIIYPNSDLRTTKLRPALVVQADNLHTGLQPVIVAMITSNLLRLGHPSRVAISIDSHEGQLTGLISDSVIVTDNLATVRVTEINHALGTWTNMTVVDTALVCTLGLR